LIGLVIAFILPTRLVQNEPSPAQHFPSMRNSSLCAETIIVKPLTNPESRFACKSASHAHSTEHKTVGAKIGRAETLAVPTAIVFIDHNSTTQLAT